MGNTKIFIVDDDPFYGEILGYQLSQNPDFEITRFSTAKECLANLHKKPQLITLDYTLPDGNGTEVLKKIKDFNPLIPVIIISSQEDINTAIGLLKLGAHDYLVKDANTKDLLWNSVLHIMENTSLKEELEQLKEELGVKYDFGKVIKGNSPAIMKTFNLIEKAVKTNINISITGETGTGKEVVAKSIHYNSDRKKMPFIAINMAAIPKELVESELFGHEKGAFTGAVGRKIGKFEEANKGTLFLDEIAELDLNIQSKLLRVLQERELTRIGGKDTIKLDVRLIIATHKNLAYEVKNGTFREDLYYRLMGMPIELPPLRERGNDILILTRYFLDEFCASNKLSEVQISREAKDKLMQYSYPGNIRELKSIIELAAVMCNGNVISAEDIIYNSLSDNHLMSSEKTLKEYTIEIIKHYLKKYDNNVVKVAEKLDIGKSTIYKMIQEKEITL